VSRPPSSIAWGGARVNGRPEGSWGGPEPSDGGKCGNQPAAGRAYDVLATHVGSLAARSGRAALTTGQPDNHSLASERWGYVRYSDGSEELYDHDNDELEWTNLADKPQYADIKPKPARWLPKVNAPDAPTAGAKRMP